MESEHFKDAELACKHCGVNLCTQQLLDALEQFRALVGKPVMVDDAYRCKVHNKAIGGVSDSQHVDGTAADIRVEGLSGGQLEKLASSCDKITAIGRSDNPPYIHVDVRPVTVGRVLWAYKDGTWCHYFPPPTEVA